MTPFKGILYFQANDGTSGYELWRSDGTTPGTYRVKNIGINDPTLDMGDMMPTSQALYFSALLPSGKNSLWKSNGTAGSTVMLKEFEGQPTAHLFSTYGNLLVFTLEYSGYLELWVSNGTIAGTALVETLTDMKTMVAPYEVDKINNGICFLASDGGKNHIWVTNGSAEGTFTVPFDGNVHELEEAGGTLYLSAENQLYGWELFWLDQSGLPVPATAQQLAATTQTLDAETTEWLDVYPNPFTTEINLFVADPDNEGFDIAIYDSRGVISRSKLDCNVNHELGGGLALDCTSCKYGAVENTRLIE